MQTVQLSSPNVLNSPLVPRLSNISPYTLLQILETYVIATKQDTFLHPYKTYLTTAYGRVLLEKLTCSQLDNKRPAFYGTHRFITSLQEPATCPYLEPDQSSPCPHPTYWRSFLILSSHLGLGLPSGFFPSGFPTKTLYTPLLSPQYVLHAPPISFFSILSPE